METAYITDLITTNEGYELVFTEDKKENTHDELDTYITRLELIELICKSLNMDFEQAVEYEFYLKNLCLNYFLSTLQVGGLSEAK